MSFWKFITVVVIILVTLWTLKSLGWIGREPAADIKVTEPQVAPPVAKAPTAIAPRAVMRPKKRKRIATGSVPTEEMRVQSARSEEPRADVSVAAAPEQQSYYAKLPDRIRYTLGNRTLGYMVTLSKVKVLPKELNIRIEVESSTRHSAGVSSRDFSLLVNGEWFEPKMSFGDRMDPGPSRPKEVIFDIPPALNSTVLRIKAYGDNVEIPLDLTPPASLQ